MNDLSGSSFFPTETGRIDSVERVSLRAGAPQSEKSRLNDDTLAAALTVKLNIKDIFSSEISDVLENNIY
ncbi:hypothetical protein TNCV_3927561 [Trichonephila clavipes]|nr:hypothetical protein TNCV_3927561 [Trichonephila clavipes]